MSPLTVFFLIFAIFFAVDDTAACLPPKCKKPDPLRAIVALRGPTAVTGNITFTEPYDGDLKVEGKIIGLTPGKHGLHVHATGNITGGCASSGLHYNPFNDTHGDITDDVRHEGDYGNIVADQNGVAIISFTDEVSSLKGKYSIIGRTLVVHEKEDDLGRVNNDGSKATGNSGGRLACGVIGVL